ncbi:MAG: hypothetical protein GWN14_17455 [candidate division Zixibacteria bacterium]|nr:hypothetical protein [candidate division Zixibacteria bacterium]
MSDSEYVFLQQSSDRTWCDEQIEDDGVKYIRCDLYCNDKREMAGKLLEFQQENESLRVELGRHQKQILDRIPIYMAEKVDSWPKLLTTISQLKQDRNNFEVWYEQEKTDKRELVEVLGKLKKKLEQNPELVDWDGCNFILDDALQRYKEES